MPIHPEFLTERLPIPPVSQEPQPQVYQSIDFFAGLVTNANPINIPDNSFQLVNNVTYVRNQTLPRNGLSAYSLTKPDSLRVLALLTFFQSTYGVQFLRFTKSSIYRAGSTGWTNFTGPALVGTDKDPYSFTVADNRGFFSNNGSNVIQEIFPGTTSYNDLGNAPRYRYIASAFNRLIGANRRDTTDVPYEIGWSGDLNYSEWNPLVDISAGSTPLVTSPADLSDDITGVFNLESVLCIPRQRSIWLGTNLPSATNPFNFTLAVPRIGCDCPQTVALAEDGIFFYNFQNSTAYFYVPGSQPEEISQQVKRALKSDVTSVNNIFASYNFDTRTYSLFLTDDNASLVKSYSFNLDLKNWAVDEYTNVSMVNDSTFSGSSVTIDELSGTIAGLSGTIDELGGVPAEATRFFGFSDGTLATQPLFVPGQNDTSLIVSGDLGITTPSSFWVSKTFIIPGYEGVYNHLQVEYTPYNFGTVEIQYSKDDQSTWVSWKLVTITSGMRFKSQIIAVNKPVRARKLTWRFITTCMCTLDAFRMEVDQSGLVMVTSS